MIYFYILFHNSCLGREIIQIFVKNNEYNPKIKKTANSLSFILLLQKLYDFSPKNNTIPLGIKLKSS